jgi:hypothetical protein
MKKLFVLMFAALAAPAFAGSESGTVVFAHWQYGSNVSTAGYTFFFLEGGTKSDNPACSTNAGGQRWVLANDWPAAKYQIATLMSAFLSGKRVAVIGSNTCSVWGDTETVVDIRLID